MKGFGGMAGLMKQANQMQMKMKKAQEELATKEFSGTAGGGAVNVRVNGDNKILAITINPDAASDIEMLQDLVMAAVNDAIKIAKDETAKEMSKITGGMNIPGMF